MSEEVDQCGGVSKKMPLNANLVDESLVCGNSRIVDIEWETVYQLSTKNLSKVLRPDFKITLSILSRGDFISTKGATTTVPYSSKRNMV